MKTILEPDNMTHKTLRPKTLSSENTNFILKSVKLITRQSQGCFEIYIEKFKHNSLKAEKLKKPKCGL